MYEIKNDVFYACIAEYKDCVVDFCLVANDEEYSGIDSHRKALFIAAKKISSAFEGWKFDISRAEAEMKEIKDFLFLPAAPAKMNENPGNKNKFSSVSYYQAFLNPPHGNGYTDSDFSIINSALFPNGADETELYEWTTDWFDYFDEGHEWWGALCLTAYDKSLDRFAVIMASATD